MTAETARTLAQALRARAIAESGLLKLLDHTRARAEIPPAMAQSMVILAGMYVEQQTVINRIIEEGDAGR